MVKGTGYTCRGPKSDPQHTYGGSKPCVTPVLGVLMPSSDLWIPGMHMVQAGTRNTPT